MLIGEVISLWRYPVKSLLGECLTNVDIDTRGVVGDRLFAISDSEGKFGSGKNTRRFRRIDGLFSLSAQTTPKGVTITFPDDRSLLIDAPSVDNALSENLAQKVTLTKEEAISHFDDGALHIVTTSSLSALQSRLPDAEIRGERFRPNIIIDSMHNEQDLVGKTVKIGRSSIEFTHLTERCRMVTMKQGDIQNKPEIIKHISQELDLHFGVYAKVLSAGDIRVGDKVEVV